MWRQASKPAVMGGSGDLLGYKGLRVEGSVFVHAYLTAGPTTTGKTNKKNK